MKITLILALLATTAARAATPVWGDFDGDGSQDIALAVGGAAEILVGYDPSAASGPEWRYVPVRRFSSFDGKFLRAEDLNNDGHADLYVAGLAANHVRVLWGSGSREVGFEPQEFVVGPGPAAADVIERGAAPATGKTLAVAVVARPSPGIVGFRPLFPEVAPEMLGTLSPFPVDSEVLDFRAGSLSGAPGGQFFSTIIGAGGETTWLVALMDGSLARRATYRLPSSYDTTTDWAFPTAGTSNPVAVAWGAGQDEIAIVELAGTGPLPTQPQMVQLSFVYEEIRVITDDAEGDRLLVLAADGLQAQILDGALQVTDSLLPPGGRGFASLAAADDGFIFATFTDGGYGIYAPGGVGYQLSQMGTPPAPPIPVPFPTIALFSGDPFGFPAPLESETFAVGDWTTGASFAAGVVSASAETFGGGAAGLGTSVAVSLPATDDPGAGGVALGNQFEPDSSMAYATGVLTTADGAAAVAVDPPGGTYAHSLAVTFETGPGVTVHYRKSGQGWQQGNGPVAFATSGGLQYFGVHASGVQSALRTASYTVDQPAGTDSDGDLVPDALEELLGTDPFTPDSDGDNTPDGVELLAGDDPLDPASGGSDDASQSVAENESLILRLVPDPATAPGATAIGGDVFNQRVAEEELAGTFDLPVPFDIDLPIMKVFLPAGHAITHPLGGAVVPLGLHTVGLYVLPEVGDKVPVDLASADPVGDWVDAFEAAQTPVVQAAIGPESTVAALVVEYWLGARLAELGDVNAPIITGRLPNAAGEPSLTKPQLAAVESPQGPDLVAHDLAQVIVQSQADLPAALIGFAAQVFAEATAANLAGSPLAAPVRALRLALAGEPLPAGYTQPLAPAAVVALRDQALAGVTPRPVLEATGRLDFAAGNLVLEAAGGVTYSLFDADGQPVRLPGFGLLVPDTPAALTAFDLGTGSGAVEVITLALLDAPPVDGGSDSDSDGDGLDDALELAFKASLDGGFWDDFDGDGYADGEEFVLGGDLADALSHPPGAPVFPAALATSITGDGRLRIEWQGNRAATYTVQTASDLASFQPAANPPVESPPGYFTWEAPAISTEGSTFARIRISIR